MNGYYTEHGRKNEKASQADLASSKIEIPSSYPVLDLTEKSVVAGRDTKYSSRRQSSAFLLHQSLSTGCDTILMFSGAKIVGSIQAVTKESVVYKPCNMAESAALSVSKVKVNKILYANGSVVLVRKSDTKISAAPNELDAKYTPSFSFLIKSDLERSKANQVDRSEVGLVVLRVFLVILVSIGAIAGLIYLSTLGG